MDIMLAEKTTDSYNIVSDKYNDIFYDELGKIKTVSNERFVEQQTKKFLLTERGTDKLHPWYGTTIPIMVGTPIGDLETMATLRSEIETALQYLVAMFKDKTNKYEKISSYRNFTIYQNENDLTKYYVYFDLATEAGTLSAISMEL